MRKHTWRLSLIVVLVGLCVVGLQDQAHAYIDPGMGSLMVQALLAGLLGVVLFARQLLMKVTSLLSRKKKSTPGA